MPHRVEDPAKIRLAHQFHEDAKTTATENAYRAIAAGEYRDERRYYGGREKPKPADANPFRAPAVQVADGDPTMTPQAIRERFAGQAVTPTALTFGCAHADPGEFCWPSMRGVCGFRIGLASRALTTTRGAA